MEEYQQNYSCISGTGCCSLFMLLWLIIFFYPGYWHITSDARCYQRYGIWRETSSLLGAFSLPFYDAIIHSKRCPAHNAVIRNDLARLKGLDKSRLAADQPDEFNMTPLTYAARYGLAEELNYLLSEGANPNIVTWGNKTAIMHALDKNHAAIAMALLENGADCTLTNSAGVTVVHTAAANDLDQLIAKMAELNNNLNVADKAGLTPLDYAIQKSAIKSIRQLAASGAKCNFSTSPSDSKVTFFLKHWQESGETPFIIPLQAERMEYNSSSTDSIPAELPKNVKPQTFKNLGH